MEESVSCGYCGLMTDDFVAHARDRHGITPADHAANLQRAGGKGFKKTKSGLFTKKPRDGGYL